MEYNFVLAKYFTIYYKALVWLNLRKASGHPLPPGGLWENLHNEGRNVPQTRSLAQNT